MSAWANGDTNECVGKCSSGKRLGSNALASQLYRSSSFNSSGRSSTCDTADDMYSDVSLEEDVIDLNHKEWRFKPHGRIPISRLSQIDTLLFADDIVFMAASEDNSQRLVYNFNQMAERFNMAEGNRPLGRPRRRWEDNIKVNLREVGYDCREWISLAQDRTDDGLVLGR
ncbi:hypothetical protein ANN_23892 [Periplaneta americana]|uniref:Reverse transcriptase domain-containing protein n=1 Tax=Periplaneta americana TaxID=6978 RepID=A0ABQ8S1L1_PERAM|nr:hypothetical protein ANN_23892 [Periplaneta americana]